MVLYQAFPGLCAVLKLWKPCSISFTKQKTSTLSLSSERHSARQESGSQNRIFKQANTTQIVRGW